MTASSVPAAFSCKRRWSSLGVHLVLCLLISPSPSARPANIAGPQHSHTGAFNVESQALALPHVVWIDARGLQRADVKKYIRAPGVVADETEAAVGIPHFQGSGSHRSIFPFSARARPGGGWPRGGRADLPAYVATRRSFQAKA